MSGLNVLSLFSGIGGLELGLERAGLHVVGQVEIDPFCQRVLAKHWPEVPRHDDARTAAAWWRSVPRPRVDVIAGGFPCQPFSAAGARLGMADERWGWPWMADVIRAVGPRYVLVENSAALLADADAFGTVLGDLAELGFDAEWSVLPACALGAPHARERVFLVAHPHTVDGETRLGTRPGGAIPDLGRGQSAWPDPVNRFVAACTRSRRMADGLSGGVDGRRVGALGNAVVPQVAEEVGRMLVQLTLDAEAAA